MKVSELLEQLKEAPQNAEVIISRDPEGNRFSPLDPDYSVGYWNSEFEEVEWEEDGGPSERSVLGLILWPLY